VRGQSVLWRGRVRNGIAFKSRPFVADGDPDLSIGIASANNMNALARVLVIAMDYGVRNGLSHCRFNFEFASICFPAISDKRHQLINKRRDRSDLTGERLP
jgi:hypothetical protein